MKTLIAAAALVLAGLASCSGNSAGGNALNDTTSYTTIQWKDSIVVFDTIDLGEKTNVSFHFRNTGDKPLFLSEVKAGCGCTVADYTKGAIAPGAEGAVTASFDSNKSQPGEVRKTILVTANTKGTTRHKLIFDGWVRTQTK